MPAKATQPLAGQASPVGAEAHASTPAADEVRATSPASLDPAGAWLLAAKAFQEGKRLLGASTPERALTELRRAAALHPGVVEYDLYLAWTEFLIGNAEAQNNKLASLKQMASQAIQKEPAFAFAHFVLGRVATLEGLERHGARFFRRALELEPGMVAAERYLRLLNPRIDTPPSVTHERLQPSVTHERLQKASEPPRPSSDKKVNELAGDLVPRKPEADDETSADSGAAVPTAVPVGTAAGQPAARSMQEGAGEGTPQEPTLHDSVAPALPKRGLVFPVALALAGLAVAIGAALTIIVSAGDRGTDANARVQAAPASVRPTASALPTSAVSPSPPSSTQSPAVAPASAPAPAPASASALAPAPAPVVASAAAYAAADPNVGTVRLPAWTRGRRVYVDGRVVGEGPEPLRVRCGTHLLRLGSAGEDQSVEVPCGGAVRVGP